MLYPSYAYLNRPPPGAAVICRIAFWDPIDALRQHSHTSLFSSSVECMYFGPQKAEANSKQPPKPYGVYKTCEQRSLPAKYTVAHMLHIQSGQGKKLGSPPPRLRKGCQLSGARKRRGVGGRVAGGSRCGIRKRRCGVPQSLGGELVSSEGEPLRLSACLSACGCGM